MKNWNRTAVIKTVIIAVLTLPHLTLSDPLGKVNIADTLIVSAEAAVFAFLMLPLQFKFIFGMFFRNGFEKPSWNDNPLSFKHPLRFIQFMSVFFMATGVTLIASGVTLPISEMSFNRFTEHGFMTLGFGTGMYLSIFLTLRWSKKETGQPAQQRSL